MNDSLYITAIKLAHNDKECLADKAGVQTLLQMIAEGQLESVNHIFSLIYINLKSHGLLCDLPKHHQLKLKNKYMYLMARQMNQDNWLRQSSVQLKQDNIKCILLKGSCFNYYIYTNDAPRVGSDIDLLVQEQDFNSVCGLLGETMESVDTQGSIKTSHSSFFEKTFISKNDVTLTVDVHCALTNPFIFNIDHDEIWDRVILHPAFEKEKFYMMSPEVNLLHLAVHGFRDLSFVNHNTLDAHELFCKSDIDYDELLKTATQWGAKSVLFWLLFYSKHILKTPIKNDFLLELQPRLIKYHVGKMLSTNKKMLQNDEGLAGLIRTRMRQILAQFFMTDKLMQGVKFQRYYLMNAVQYGIKNYN